VGPVRRPPAAGRGVSPRAAGYVDPDGM